MATKKSLAEEGVLAGPVKVANGAYGVAAASQIVDTTYTLDGVTSVDQQQINADIKKRLDALGNTTGEAVKTWVNEQGFAKASEVTDISDSLDSTKDDVSEAETDIQKLFTTTTDMQEDIDGVKSDLATAKEDTNNLAGQLDVTNAHVTDNEAASVAIAQNSSAISAALAGINSIDASTASTPEALLAAIQAKLADVAEPTVLKSVEVNEKGEIVATWSAPSENISQTLLIDEETGEITLSYTA